jgi:DNA-binding transcriptional LysR family regulator
MRKPPEPPATDDPARAVFVAVVEAGSFAAAARRLGTTTSAVSKRIAAIETRLGARLVHRSSRHLAPTQAGLAFYERCRRIADDVAEAERAVREGAGAPVGAVRVSAPLTFSQQHLVPLLPDFLAAHPRVDVVLVADDRYVDVIEEGVDLAIRTGALPDSGLVRRKLAFDRRVVCASPAYLAQHGAPRAPAELASHACMRHAGHTQHGGAGRWTFEGPGGRASVPVRGRFQVNHTGMIRDAALAGLGVALLPLFAIGDDLRSGRLVALLEDWRVPPEVGIHALFPAGRSEPAAVRAFVEFLAARLPARLNPGRTDPSGRASAGAPARRARVRPR